MLQGYWTIKEASQERRRVAEEAETLVKAATALTTGRTALDGGCCVLCTAHQRAILLFYYRVFRGMGFLGVRRLFQC